MRSRILLLLSIVFAISAWTFKMTGVLTDGVSTPVTEFLAIMFGVWACYAAIKEARSGPTDP